MSLKSGSIPFTIGLWVGKKVTPNTTADSHEAIQKEREDSFGTSSTPAQLTSCPWCGSEIAMGRDIHVDKDAGRTFIYCGDKYGRCEFSRTKYKELGLPVLVVDDEIYRYPPSMLIATVDKFALMAWRGKFGLFLDKYLKNVHAMVCFGLRQAAMVIIEKRKLAVYLSEDDKGNSSAGFNYPR
ncbi:hypothetical protein QO179_04980 [Bacillus stercoris]|nr:hypothetical protein [Bacillus stercoris]